MIKKEKMLVVGIDFESTGRDTANDQIIEAAAVLYDTEIKTPLKLFSSLIRPTNPLPDGYVSPTGICGEWLLKYGVNFHEAFGQIQLLLAQCDPMVVVSHNGNKFDKPLALAQLSKHSIMNHGLAEAHWIDTLTDVNYKTEQKSKSLTNLAAEHEFINYYPHRALFDVMTMLKLVGKYSFNEIIDISKMPLITIRALVTYEMEKERQAAKEMKYQYSGPPKKIWTKDIRENNFEAEKKAAADKGFEIVRI